MRQLDDDMSVAGQIMPHEVAGLADQGIRMIVNNRPDGEEPDQPPAAQVEAAAAAAGIAYRHVPMAQLTREAVDGMAQALGAADGPVLAFCRSGTRSTFLWAMARSEAGADADELSAKAMAAGYDLTPIRRFLR